MLWLALQFPLLPVELLPISAPSESWAITEGTEVVACNASASAHGVKERMSLSAACALLPTLLYQQRNCENESVALNQLAAWAGQFSSAVSLQSPDGLILEIEGSLRLLGQIQGITSAIRSGCADMGYTVVGACAPTWTAAWMLASARVEKIILHQNAVRKAISALPVDTLSCDERTVAALNAVGVRTVGQLLSLPRDGVARRFGQSILDQIDRAMGLLPEPREFYTTPATFAASLEFPANVTHAEALVFAARRLLTQLAGFLASRCGGIEWFRVRLLHDNAAATVLDIRLASPTRELDRLVILIRERFASLALTAPVYKITIEADEILSLTGNTTSLFPETIKDAGDCHRLIERLQARLGPDAVQGLSSLPDHRPERSWESSKAGAKADTGASTTRPLWLLEKPRLLTEVGSKPHYEEEPLTVVAGPEIVEAGWWNGDVKRDYFVAQSPAHSTYWIFRERQEHGAWYLHGIFG